MNSRINESRSKKVVLQDPLLQQNRKETQPQQEAMITLKHVHISNNVYSYISRHLLQIF